MPMMLEIITAEQQVFSEEVDMVVAPGIDGQLGILPRHAPLMTMLQPGELTIRKDGTDTYLAVTGGFMEVLANRVIVLADACERSDEIDEERAQTAMQRAQEQLASGQSEMELQRAVSALRRAQTRLDLVRRRRHRLGRATPQRRCQRVAAKPHLSRSKSSSLNPPSFRPSPESPWPREGHARG